ncbi:hypothetical protein T492DRAFT_908619, partial [Pavlovales sp. CCMP2436]
LFNGCFVGRSVYPLAVGEEARAEPRAATRPRLPRRPPTRLTHSGGGEQTRPPAHEGARSAAALTFVLACGAGGEQAAFGTVLHSALSRKAL